jgi:uncharacterized repeat protein (TIGR03803 family)
MLAAAPSPRGSDADLSIAGYVVGGFHDESLPSRHASQGSADGTARRMNSSFLQTITSATFRSQLYGTTAGGQAGTTMGSVFRLSPKGKFKLLRNFGAGGVGGALPYAALVMDLAGNLYGDTYSGGSSNEGTIFKLDKKGNFGVLYSFAGGRDGAGPGEPLILDPTGNLYGTTILGGTGNCNEEKEVGCGVVFKLDTTGKERVLHRSLEGRTASIRLRV